MMSDEETSEHRRHVRAWIEANPSPSPRQLAEAGYVAPHWPRPWGLDADPHLQLIIDEELAAADISRPNNAIALGWAGPTIVAGGTPEQQQRWLPAILDGTESWCQLFSEPDAGSDLAAVRTTAVRDGDYYIVTGQKIWSSWANHSQWGILLARTDPSVPKHKGISYFVVDMASPGIEIRPIVEMTGGNHFNETFFDAVAIPVENRIGAEGDGWRLANVTLGNERVSLSEGGVLWGMGPTFAECVAEIRRRGANGAGRGGDGAGVIGASAAMSGDRGGMSPAMRQRAARVYSECFVTNLLSDKIVDAILRGEDPSPYASIRKAKADVNGQALMNLITDLAGPAAMLGQPGPDASQDDPWHWAFLFSRALTIGGGTSEIQRNIIGERLLGLPREPKI